jgi:hypothetical protein
LVSGVTLELELFLFLKLIKDVKRIVKELTSIKMDRSSRCFSSFSLNCINTNEIIRKSNFFDETSYEEYENSRIQKEEEEKEFATLLEERKKTNRALLLEKIGAEKANYDTVKEAILQLSTQQFEYESKLSQIEEQLQKYEDMKKEIPKSQSDNNISKKKGNILKKLSILSKNKK